MVAMRRPIRLSTGGRKNVFSYTPFRTDLRCKKTRKPATLSIDDDTAPTAENGHGVYYGFGSALPDGLQDALQEDHRDGQPDGDQEDWPDGDQEDDADDPADHQRWEAIDNLLIPAGELAQYVSIDDIRQIINASHFATWRKKPLTVCVTIRWDTATDRFDPSPRAWLRRQGRLLDRMGKWLHRNNLPTAYVWVREISRTRIAHTHLVMHLPVKHWGAFRKFLVETGGFRDGAKPFDPVVMRGGSYGMQTLNMRAGALRYILKGMDMAATYRDPVTYQTANIAAALRVDNRREKRLPIAGKRAGVSRTLDRLARADAGWREQTSIRDLRRLLNP